MNKIEVLAPAGNIESLKTAINNGADAIYLGLNSFNARGNIENFNIDELESIVNYAHLFGVKIYLTLNILFKDDEFEQIYQITKKALQANVDAFIIQDIGLAYFLKQNFPNIELHASTQMGFNNLEGVLFAKKMGFKRVVLARETPLEEIRRIKENCDIDLEYFVQGALCVSFSGNCYLCSLLADSSGNRGKCKQFCRLPYELQCQNLTKKGYLLSTKDFCMVPKLKELAESGISSFKIEGRARRSAYVGQSVATYRKIIDNDFIYLTKDIENLKKVFNRGNYIQGYFNDDKIIYPKAQNHIGIEIGKVVNVSKGKKFNEIFIQSNIPLHKNDVIKLFKNDKEIGVITLKDLTKLSENLYRTTTTNLIENNSNVNLIVDYEQEKQILNATKKIEVDIEFYAKENEKALLTLKTDEVSVTNISEFVIESSKTAPLTEADCILQLSKLGENFSVRKINCQIGNVFLAKSQINDFRRKSIDKLCQQILSNYNNKNNLDNKKIENQKATINLTNLTKPIQNFALIHSLDKLDTIKDKFDGFIYQPNIINIKQMQNQYEKYKNFNIYLSFSIMTVEKENNLIKDMLNYCLNWKIYANNYSYLSLAEPSRVMIGSAMNVTNSYSTKLYSTLGYENVVVSIEDLSINKIKNNGVNLFYLSFFYPEYMYLRHCPIKEHIGGSCASCQYNNEIKYKLNNNLFSLTRRKFLHCEFILKSTKPKHALFIPNFSKINEIL